jgi:hypothetical protein
MNRRIVRTGEFDLPLPPEAALLLFTPEGERLWAGASWDPSFPVSASQEPNASPGWVAGTVAVSCSKGATTDQCRVTVQYDSSSLGPDGLAFLDDLESDYDGFLGEWRQEILSALAVLDAATQDTLPTSLTRSHSGGVSE